MDSESLRIDFWDVGQGDCSVVTLPNGELIIIDVGPPDSPLIDWLISRGPCNLRAIALTHNHEDHIGALPALVNIPNVTIKHIYMVNDPDPKSDKFRRIMRPVREAVTRGQFTALHLTAGQTIWAADDGSAILNVGFPDFIRGLDATTVNKTSGILTLELFGQTEVVWAGDALLKDIDTVCTNGTGTTGILTGPHHGAPQDFKPSHTPTLQRISRIRPQRAYISVGSRNVHGHPKRKYIKHLTKNGCAVSCSQLTSGCQPLIWESKQPVLASHALLGLRAPRTGVACRGAMRFTVQDGGLVVDKWDQTHRERVKVGVHAPACLLSPR